jgi:hypothetical protein
VPSGQCPGKSGTAGPFAWDAKSACGPVQAVPAEKPNPQTLEDCLKQLPNESIEAESAGDRA